MITDVMMTCFSDDGVRLAACSRDGSVLVYDIGKDKEVCSFQVESVRAAAGRATYPYHLAFSPSGTLLAVSMKHDDRVEIWDATKGHRISMFDDDKNAFAAFTRRDDRLVSSGLRGELRHWDLSGPKLISSHKTPNESRIRALAVSPDRTTFATGTGDRLVHIWDSGSLEELATFRGHTSTIVSIKYSRDGQFLYSGSSNELAKWSLKKTSDPTLFSRTNTNQSIVAEMDVVC